RALALILASMTFGSVALPAVDLQWHPRHRPGGQELWTRTELYFGSDKPDGSVVTKAEVMQFIDREVTPRFPEGLTLLTGYGQFLDSEGTIEKERSTVLILFYPVLTFEANKKIQEIRDCYKRSFRQESVLRVDSLSNVSF